LDWAFFFLAGFFCAAILVLEEDFGAFCVGATSCKEDAGLFNADFAAAGRGIRWEGGLSLAASVVKPVCKAAMA
jgi:hypothetical protein